MTELQKKEIVAKLTSYVERFESQNKAANSIKGVSSATISQMIHGNWELIADEMWRNLASQIGWEPNSWQPVETKTYTILSKLLQDAQANSLVFAVTGEAGTGKTFTAKNYADNNKRVYLLQCNEYWNRKMFMQELLMKMGRDYSGYTVGEMMHEVVRGLKSQQDPLIFMDEADKLSDQVLYFFITLYNQLEDRCGIVMCATNHLEKRINRGIKLNKKGYNEIFSRIGRRFIELKGINANDISSICSANGLDDSRAIKEVIQDCEGDLRRVKRKIHALKSVSN